jgi:hypothetical protein
MAGGGWRGRKAIVHLVLNEKTNLNRTACRATRGTMTWFGAVWMIIRVGFALAVGKAGFSRISERLMPRGQ